MLIARTTAGQALGCVCVKPLPSARECEMKRMFVRPAARRLGLGRRLAVTALKRALTLDAGYDVMRLDSLDIPRLQPAIRLYISLGFQACGAYCHNPLPRAVYYARRLDTP